VPAVGLKRYARSDRIFDGPDVTTDTVPDASDQCSVAAWAVPTAAIPHSAPHAAISVGMAYAKVAKVLPENVTTMFPPLGVTGRPVVAESQVIINGEVDGVPEFFHAVR
jgi:hypothetical protein